MSASQWFYYPSLQYPRLLGGCVFDTSRGNNSAVKNSPLWSEESEMRVLCIVCAILVSGCSVMRDVGQSLEAWGSQQNGIIGKSAVIAGSVYQEAGCLGQGEDDQECQDKAE